MKKKLFISSLLLFVYTVNSYCYSVSELSSQLKTFNKQYILPILGAGLGIYAIVSGILRMGKIRKGGEEQTDAIINWLASLIWPVVVVLVAEGLVLAFASIFS